LASEPPKDERDEDGFSPETFRADLLHQRAFRLNGAARIAIAISVAVLMLLVVGGVHIWRWAFEDLPRVPEAKAIAALDRAPGMTFLDRYGRVIATRGPKYGVAARLASLPPHVAQAFLAAEDRRFDHHGAVDWQGVGRAALANYRAGRTVEGGSTLTQQLARDLFLGPERTFKRKVQEAILADRLYSRLGRRGVLELYLNRVYLGENAFGVDAASRAYFGKPASNLTLGEAAILAGLPKAPSRLSLNRDPVGAAKRGQLVLERMRREGWITAAQAMQARAQPVVLTGREPEGDLAWALDLAAAQARADSGRYANDLVVRLTLDPALQRQAAAIVRDTLNKEGRGRGANQAAVVVLGPDGATRALIGGRNHAESPFNRAVQARRQPGSSFKPFIWAAALEKGITADDYRSTGRVAFGDWNPSAGHTGGAAELTLANALAQSSNSIAVRLAREVTPATASALARRFGITTVPSRPGLSIALGAYEVSPYEMAGAYQVFQQGGRVTPPYLVEEVARSDGTILYRRPPPAQESVYDAARAGSMVRMMSGVIQYGTGKRAAIGRPAAGKTGTSQKSRDAWFVGFTPDYVAAVWVGDDAGRPMRNVVGGEIPADIWRRVMLAAHQGVPVRQFGAQPKSQTNAETIVFENRAAFYATLAAEFGRVSSTDGMRR
jgi:penicillin-binding protein 1A